MMLSKSIFDVMRAMPVFKPDLRRANRDGRKCQTRRVIDPQPHISWTRKYEKRPWDDAVLRGSVFDPAFIFRCKYGKAGDLAYMREPLVRGFGDVAYYKDDGVMVRHALTGEAITWRWNVKTLSGMFMPKEAARSIYRYEFIRVERVQDISRDDAKAEGMSGVWRNPVAKEEHYSRVLLNPYVANFSVLWDMINGERGYSWDSNPWVWVLGYKPVTIFTPGNVGNEISGLKADFIIFDDFLGGV